MGEIYLEIVWGERINTFWYFGENRVGIWVESFVLAVVRVEGFLSVVKSFKCGNGFNCGNGLCIIGVVEAIWVSGKFNLSGGK